MRSLSMQQVPEHSIEAMTLMAGLNAIWRRCRDHGASPASTIARYHALGIPRDQASTILSVQLARLEQHPAHPAAGELGFAVWPLSG